MKPKKTLVALAVVAFSCAPFVAAEDAKRPFYEEAQEMALELGAAEDAFPGDRDRIPTPKGVVSLIREYTYEAGDDDSKNTCRQKALELLLQTVLMEIGTAVLSDSEDVQSEKNGEDFSSVKNRLVVLSGGVTKAEVLSEDWNGVSCHLKAKVQVDPEEVRTNLKKAVDEWLKDRRAVLERLAAVEGAPGTSQRSDIFTDSNFNACQGIYVRTYTSAKASDVCFKKTKSFQFINNKNFDSCYSTYVRTYSSAEAADVCIKKTKSFQFINNKNFDSCYSTYVHTYSSAKAADTCIKLTSQ
jgi:hypothetical protein